jgi:hypothetical protein
LGVLAWAEGDEHTLGLPLAELCLVELGWTPLWLGARTPTVETIRMAPVDRREARRCITPRSPRPPMLQDAQVGVGPAAGADSFRNTRSLHNSSHSWVAPAQA